MTTIHVRYEILDAPGDPDPGSLPEAYQWGVRAVGLPGKVTAYGVGETLEKVARSPSPSTATVRCQQGP
jgi:hypothetical protein